MSLATFCEGGEEFASICSHMFNVAAEVQDHDGMVLALEALTSQLPYLLPVMVAQMEQDAEALAAERQLQIQLT